MNLCKPREASILRGLNWDFVIYLKPNHTWRYNLTNGSYEVTRDVIEIYLSEDEFNKYFKIVGGK